MSHLGESRKLAAIFAIDVAGFSRQMGRDEVGTLTRLRTHLTERFDPILERFHGRTFKRTGDGALVDFNSAVDALSAAIAFQQSMTSINANASSESAMHFRAGLHLET